MECEQAVEIFKLNYLKNLGNQVNDPSTSHTSCWKIIKSVMNKCRAPKIPPLLVNNMFIFNCNGKVYINDLKRNIKCNIKLFADDTMLSIVENPEIAATYLSMDASMEI